MLGSICDPHVSHVSALVFSEHVVLVRHCAIVSLVHHQPSV